MFYFKDAGIPPSQMDAEQLGKVQAFKKKIADEYGGLYYQFENTDDFQTKARIHLSKVVQDWLEGNADAIESKTVAKPEDSETDSHNPLSNLVALDDGDADDGLIDLVERASEAMEEVVSVVNRMSEATNDLGGKFTQRTGEVNDLTAGGTKANMKAAKRVSNNAANDLEMFVKRMSVEIPEFYKQNSLAMETFGKVAMLSEQDFDEDTEDVKSALAQIQEYRTAIDTSSSSLVEFRQSISELPRMTTTFNRARRRAVAIMDDLLAQLRIASSQSEEVEQLLMRLLDS
jgi:methyl-accepting chemotaxis protein